MAAYADVADLEAFISESSPDAPSSVQAERMLLRASELIDDALRTAVYDVDDDGDPSGADLIAAFKDATCAQVEFWLVGDEEDDVLGPVETLTLGSMSVKPAAPLILAPRAARILRNAGLYSVQPVTL